MVLDTKSVLHYEEYIYIALNISVVIVNKYVLSVLHFTIPTVFQGWQTLVCVLTLSGLIKWNQFRLDVELLDRRTLTRLIFPLLCFSLSNVAGSKALADLPVAVFLAGTNLVPAGLAFLGTERGSAGSIKTVGCLTLCGSMVTLYVLHTGHELGWLWLGIHVVAQQVHILTMSSLRLPSTTAIYFCNFSSVILLLPLSVYLQEASSALSHARLADTEFFLGCLLSGLFGTGLQVLSGKLQGRLGGLSLYQGISKILACTLSIIYFSNDIDSLGWLLILVNLVTACFIFVVEDKIEENGVVTV